LLGKKHLAFFSPLVLGLLSSDTTQEMKVRQAKAQMKSDECHDTNTWFGCISSSWLDPGRTSLLIGEDAGIRLGNAWHLKVSVSM